MKIPMGIIKKQYVIFVDHKEFVKVAYERGFEYVVFDEEKSISLSTINQLKENNKFAIFICYDIVDDSSFVFDSDDFDYDVFNLYLAKYEFDDDIVKIRSLDDAIQYFPTVEYIEEMYDFVSFDDYSNKCGNCFKKLRKEDKYCRYCGTPRGEGDYNPANNIMETVYGPPIEESCRCSNCNYSWRAYQIGIQDAKYCPRCGGDIIRYDRYTPNEIDFIEKDPFITQTNMIDDIEKNKIVYRCAIDFLNDIKPDGIDLEGYLIGNNKEIISLKDVFIQFIASAQNYQRMPNVIKFYERQAEIAEYLYDFDYRIIKDMSPEKIYYDFREMFDVKGKDSSFNSWSKWSKSIVDSAKFISGFKDVDDFKAFVSRFDYNAETRMALPLLISKKISGIGFALACDLLKELGFIDYPKPDVHLMEVFSSLGLSEKEEISTFEAIVRMSDICKEIDPKATPYKVDKVFWLICSGYFHNEIPEVKIGRHKKQFIDYVLDRIK